LNQGKEGDWTVYGAVRVQTIELGKHQIRLHGTRLCVRRGASGLAAFEFTRDKHSHGAPPVKSSVNVEIGIDERLTTIDQAQALFANVFALNKDDLLNSVPEFWRSYLAAQLGDFDVRQGREIDFQETGSGARSNQALRSNSTQPPAPPESHEQLDRIYHVGPGPQDVRAPKARFTPEPEFTDAARYEKFQGVVVVDLVVGRDGKARSINVVRALGFGLDERAVTAIKRWSFDPATLNGEPVSVEMNVEIAFNLY
jgi:TonB family protein